MTPTPRAVRPDSGFALVELLMAVAILGTAFVAILAALATTVRSAEVHRTSADANAALMSAAESVKGAAFLPCASATDGYRDELRAETPLPSTWATGDLDVVAVICPTPELQMVTVAATAPGTTVARSLTVAKSQRVTTLPDPVTTTTTTPGPPPVSPCGVQHARAFRFGDNIKVLVIGNPREPACAWPLSARLSDEPEATSLERHGIVWSNVIPSGERCDATACTVVVADGADNVVATVLVR